MFQLSMAKFLLQYLQKRKEAYNCIIYVKVLCSI